MVQMVLMEDQAFASGQLPPGFKAVAGYLSSKTDLHDWTKADWDKFGKVKKLPIWVASKAEAGVTGTGNSEAFACLEQLYKLGVPKGSAVALDMETAVAPSYVQAFSAALNWAGFKTWVYGSASTVFGNPQPKSGGYWVADFAGKGPFMFSHAGVRATQYESGQSFDSSTVKLWQYLHSLKVW